MQKDTIIFTITTKEYIKIFLPCLIDELFRFDDVTIILHTCNGKEFIIYNNDHIMEALQVFNTLLKRALNGQKEIHSSINKDIGYLWNRDLWGKSNRLVYKTWPEGHKYWIGIEYLLWSYKKRTSWLYEKNNQLFLEVTPTYQWPSIPIKEAKKQPRFVSYREFMKNYKPYAIIPLERTTAQEWLKQTEQLIKLIEANDSKYFI